MSQKNHLSAGFTLVEVAIMVPILVLVAIVLFDALFNMVRSSSLERERVNMIYEKQTAMNAIESDTILVSKFLGVVDSGLAADPYLPASNGGAWSYLGDSSTSRFFIVREYSTTTNPLLGGVSGRKPVFIGNPSSSACTTVDLYTNQVQTYNTIYFVKNGNLFRRRLIDKTTSYCNPGQYQKLSCPSQADLTAQGLGTRNVTCDADDELLASSVSNFTVNYFDTKTGTTPLAVYTGGANPSLVGTAVDAEVSLTISRTVSGQVVSSSSTLRMSKLNPNTDGS